MTLISRAESIMPGGVNSPVRAFRSVGRKQIFARRGSGAILETADGRELIDFCMSFGALTLGHAHPQVVAAVSRAAEDGAVFGMTTEREIELAEMIGSAVPTLERIRLVNSGTEAVMTALRLARGATGREKILKFSGCYHGHADSMLVQAGSGAGRQQHHGRRCFADSAASQTTVAAYNDCEETERLIRLSGDSLAAIIVEPVAANMGLILPAPDFLHRLRELADDSGALLIFDEVITGFRTHFGCRQQLCGVTPDLTCLGKIIGGGLPIGAVGGPASIMELLAPLGPVYQAGTFSGNPISAAAGLATLRLLAEHQPYGKMAERTNLMAHMLEKQAKALGLPLNIPRLGGMFSLSFGNRAPRSLDDALKSNGELFARFFNLLLDEGIYIPPSPLETCFVSSAHDSATIERAMDSFAVALGKLAAIRKDFSTCQGMTVS